MHARSLSLALVLVFVPAAVAQKPTAADLTIRSHAILTKHCAGCHGDKPVRGNLKVLVHGEMIKNHPVALIQPKNPTASQVLELIEEGSMPPGKYAKVPEQEVAVLREWVASGDGGMKLAQPRKLLDEWRGVYRPDRSRRCDFFTLDSIATIEQKLADACKQQSVRYALAAFSAAAITPGRRWRSASGSSCRAGARAKRITSVLSPRRSSSECE